MKRDNDLEKLYRNLVVQPSWQETARRTVGAILSNQARYEKVAVATRVPWQVIAAIHWMESSGDFRTHLHNGDPLSRRTRNVPAGRPKTGNPPFTWEASALDALEYDGLTRHPWGKDRAADLFKIEAFNGLGYYRRLVNSAYLWSGCQFYDKGKFVSDGKWSPTAVSRQLGAACILRGLGW